MIEGPDVESVLLVAGGLVVVAAAASKASTRLGIPALLIFLALGMLAGSEGPGGIDFDDFELARSVGITALAYILFSGGLDTRWNEVRAAAGAALSLATLGVVATAVVTGLAATWILDLPVGSGLLLGAIVSSTDAAAVFSVLRSQGVGLRLRVRSLLEFESGSNDPMAVFLTVGLLALITDDVSSPAVLLPMVFVQFAVGALLGWGLARGTVFVVNRIQLDYAGLYPVLTLGIVAITYAAATLSGGSGFLAVYVAGLIVGNSRVVHLSSLRRFHDGIAWLMQIAMFLALGLLVFPTDLAPVALRALAVAGVLVFVARPLATMLALALTRLDWRERVFISWIGLRGAVPIILATYPQVERVANADLVFNTVFFIVIVSVMIQGTTITPAARLLGVDTLPPRVEPTLTDVVDAVPGSFLHEVEVVPGARAVGRALFELGLPPGVLAVLLTRRDRYLVPQGSTVIEAGDRILVLADAETLPAVERVLGDESGPE